MLKEFISYPSTEQFRSIVKKVKEKAQFVSYNEETEEVIVNRDAKMPIINFKGTIKLHGTQGAVVQDNSGSIHYQSRKNIVTVEKDNVGFSFFCDSNREIFVEYFKEIRQYFPEDTISIYGEFCGGKIQKNVAINGLPKMFVMFGIKITPQNSTEETPKSFWIENNLRTDGLVKNINDFKTFSIDIDFDRPDMSQNEMIRLTTLVGDECPVGKSLGNTGIGEGIVWSYLEDGERLIFKTKDERHSKGSGKVKTLSPVDEEKENIKRLFVSAYACTRSRLDQMYTEIVHSVHNGDSSLMSMTDIKQYLGLVIKDVIKEESDTMSLLGLEPKPLNGMISKVAVGYFRSRLDEEVGL